MKRLAIIGALALSSCANWPYNVPAAEPPGQWVIHFSVCDYNGKCTKDGPMEGTKGDIKIYNSWSECQQDSITYHEMYLIYTALLPKNVRCKKMETTNAGNRT
jgi:hypothetical protein